MRSLERGRRYESINNSVSRLAYAYGFAAPALSLPRKLAGGVSASLALLKQALQGANQVQPTQVWGAARGPKGSSMLSFAVIASRHAAAHALTIEVARAIAAASGLRDVTVLVSSAGDQESKRRFARELTNFFRKRVNDLPEEVKHDAAHDPEAAYRALIVMNHALVQDAPHRIDYLSENSRKVMLDTLALFEAAGIPYSIEPALPADPAEMSELIFALEGADARGNRARVAVGGRYDEFLKRAGRDMSAVSMTLSVPDHVDPETVEEAPACFVVHVGDVAKLKLFLILRSLWASPFLVGEALMLGTLREQMDTARASGARYIAIVGQREALDGTIIVRSTATQLQTVIPMEKLTSYLEHKA